MFENQQFIAHLGNCLDVMRSMADNSVDAVVTDPPYGLNDKGFQGLSDGILDALLNIVLPDFDQGDSPFVEDTSLSGVPVSGSTHRLKLAATARRLTPN